MADGSPMKPANRWAGLCLEASSPLPWRATPPLHNRLTPLLCAPSSSPQRLQLHGCGAGPQGGLCIGLLCMCFARALAAASMLLLPAVGETLSPLLCAHLRAAHQRDGGRGSILLLAGCRWGRVGRVGMGGSCDARAGALVREPLQVRFNSTPPPPPSLPRSLSCRRAVPAQPQVDPGQSAAVPAACTGAHSRQGGNGWGRCTAPCTAPVPLPHIPPPPHPRTRRGSARRT